MYVQVVVLLIQTYCFLPFSLLKLPIVVIQKICFNGNVTSHFSVTSLYFKRYFYKYKTKLIFILPYSKYFKMR